MRYGPDIVKQITEELQKVPNIRYACKKVGINHSTFYRWMGAHFTFHQSVEGALFIGRELMNNAAEGVIITGIQNGDYRSAVYWLSHNHDKYIGVDRVEYHQYLEKHALEFLNKDIPKNSNFEILFDHYFQLEDAFSPKKAKEMIDSLVDVMAHTDIELKNIFYVVYGEWKRDRIDYQQKRNKAESNPLDTKEKG